MIMLVAINDDDDKRTIEEYMKDLRNTANPMSELIYDYLKVAVLNGVCSLDDNVNVGLKKIGESVQRQG